MRDELRRYWLRPGVAALAIITGDQITKAAVRRAIGMEEGASLTLIGDWLRLTVVHNTGVAFGLFQGFPHIFTFTSILISIGAVIFYRMQLPHNQPWVQASVGLIVGGAIGNIIDRLRQGYVYDFIHVTWFPGIFNIADSAITIGVGMLAGYLLLLGDGEQRGAPADDALLGELLSRDPRGGGRR